MRTGIGLVLIALLAACSSANSATPRETDSGKIAVVAAENFWGSIAAQLGGDHAQVTSIITSPDTDPHDYEPTPQDGRAIASAQYVIFNGLGYDVWVAQALEANPGADRTTLEVGDLLGLEGGDNPHRWYFPGDVDRVIAQITADYKRLDPANADYFDARRDAFETVDLKRYKDLIGEIAQRYGGTPVGASESIFVGIADATGLDLKTPRAFLTAISEGTDPSAQDKAIVDEQIAARQIKVFVANSQNSTPDVANLVSQAQAAGIEVATITETPPEDVAFEDWQTQQLQNLVDALARATGT